MKTRILTAIQTFHQMRKKRFFQVSIGLSLLWLGLSVAIPWWQLFPELNEQIAVPLHYNIHFGVDLFGPPWRLWVFPSAGTGILVLNTLLAFLFWRRDHVLSYFFSATAAIVSAGVLVAMVFVTLLNMSYA